MVKLCLLCNKERAILKRPKTGQHICRGCFFNVFETEIHETIVSHALFKPGDRVAIGASGGKGTYMPIFYQLFQSDSNRKRQIRRCWLTS
jgi:hypothetical protein